MCSNQVSHVACNNLSSIYSPPLIKPTLSVFNNLIIFDVNLLRIVNETYYYSQYIVFVVRVDYKQIYATTYCLRLRPKYFQNSCDDHIYMLGHEEKYFNI